MKYPFTCESCTEGFEFEKPIAEDFPSVVECPNCGGTETVRIFLPLPDIWNTDGAHKTDYNEHGFKRDLIRARYKQATGEEPPPPAKNTPRNYKVER